MREILINIFLAKSAVFREKNAQKHEKMRNFRLFYAILQG